MSDLSNTLENAFTNSKDFVASAVDNTKQLGIDAFGNVRGNLSTSSQNWKVGQILSFPSDLRGKNFSGLTVIEFSAYERDGNIVRTHKVYLPAPTNLQSAQTADYGGLGMGASTNSIIKSLASVGQRSGQNLSPDVSAAIYDFIKGSALKTAESIVPDAVKNAVKFASKTVTNPHTNTTFEGNSVRTYSYTFKMMAQSSGESLEIAKIQRMFRRFVYARAFKDDQASFLLSYPPVWRIRFVDMGNKKENEFIPKIYSCYLTDCSVSINENASVFYERGGAPLDVSITLTFKETRVLTRTDIDKLDAGASESDLIDAFGNANTAFGSVTVNAGASLSDLDDAVKARADILQKQAISNNPVAGNLNGDKRYFDNEGTKIGDRYSGTDAVSYTPLF